MSLTLLSCGLVCKPFKTLKGTRKAFPMTNHWSSISANNSTSLSSLGAVLKTSGVPK